MEKLYPQVSDMCYICNEENLCPVRKKDGKWMLRFLDWDWSDSEIELRSVLNKDEFKGKKINKLYSSGFVFLRESEINWLEVFLLTTKKNWKLQHQFTGGSQLEEKYEHIFQNNDEWDLIIDMKLVLWNAERNLYERINVTKVNLKSEKPTADWVMKPSSDWKSWDLIFLISFLGDNDFEWELRFNKDNSKNVVDWKWYSVDWLDSTEWLAPNIVAVTEELIYRQNKKG